VGTVTRQILDRAVSHGMTDRPVESVMQPELPTVNGDTSLAELRDLFLERSYRFVVVEEDGRPIGIITRMELFRRLFERQHSAGAVLDHRMAGARPVSQPVTRLLRERSPEWVLQLLTATKRVADEIGETVYLVGGMVRDLLLDRPNEDVDLVVEGDGIAFAQALAEAIGGRYHPHAPFLTAVITLPTGEKVDVASARTEFYRTPAALPEVATSLIRQDLYRRDFTINALAIALTSSRYGELVDFFGGRKDLHRKEIRVLHSLSFIDDPTRAIRAVRYARRLGFTIAHDTRNLITTAIHEGMFDRLSGQRLMRELHHLLDEPHPTPSLALLAELGLLPAISHDLAWDEQVRSFLLEVEGQFAWYRLEQLGPPPEPWLLYLGGLALRAPNGAPARLADRLQLSGDLRRRTLALADGVSEVRAASLPNLVRSERVTAVESHPPEVLLLAMAGLDIEARRRVANAAVAAVRVLPPVTGREILAAGIAPGPHVGIALKRTRDAIVDGELSSQDALEFAVSVARNSQTEVLSR
jgi:tRNA nucleotidyltransferase (CCA-adding enzyme)